MTPQQLNAMKLALEALEDIFGKNKVDVTVINVIKEVLAEHAMSEVQRLGQEIEQEPVAWLSTDSIGERHLCFDKPLDNDPVQPLFTSPPQRTWVGLTKEQISEFDIWHDNREEEVGWVNPSEIVAYIETKLKEKNT